MLLVIFHWDKAMNNGTVRYSLYIINYTNIMAANQSIVLYF